MKHVFWFIIFVSGLSQIQGQELYKHEVFFGLGWAKSYEKDIFNLSPDTKASPDLAINFSYLYHVDQHFGFGCHFYGFTLTTPSFIVTTNQGTKETTFDIAALNLGVQGRYTFMTGWLEPYVYVTLNLASGSTESKVTGSLEYNGYSFGGGAGVNKRLSKQVYASLEVISSYGDANWKQKPFTNSSGKEFDPSMTAIVMNVSYRWDLAK